MNPSETLVSVRTVSFAAIMGISAFIPRTRDTALGTSVPVMKL